MLKKSTLDLETIDFLRFPLAIAVVFIHWNPISVIDLSYTFTTKSSFPIYDLIHYIISEEIARIAVPLFFFMSGYLFFFDVQGLFTISQYIKKIKKRVRTLLIPYIFWNTSVIILLVSVQLFIPSTLSGANKPITDRNFLEFLNMFWGCTNGMPICYQFWFVRDLIVTVLLSPIIYFFIKRLKFHFVAVMGIIWLLGFDFNITGLSSVSIFFFSFGAWFSINSRIFTNDFSSLRYTAIIYLGLLAFNTLLYQYDELPCYYNITLKVNILIEIISVVSGVSYGLTRNFIRINKFLPLASFFIYAYHTTLILLLTTSYIRFFKAIILRENILVIGYLIIPFIIAIIGVGLYVLLDKYFPSFTVLITGRRASYYNSRRI